MRGGVNDGNVDWGRGGGGGRQQEAGLGGWPGARRGKGRKGEEEGEGGAMHSVPRFPRRPRRACRGPPLLLCPQPPAPSMLAATPRCPACRYYRPALLLVVVLVQAILAHWRAELVWMEKDGALPSFSQVLIVAAMGNGCAPTAAARTCCRSAWAAAAAVVVTLCSVRRDHLALASSSRCVCAVQSWPA